MTFLLYLTFIILTTIILYYFIYLNNMNHHTLFTIILNYILLSILPIYHFYFKDDNYSILISFSLLIASFSLNLKIKEVFRKTKILPLIYFILSSILFGEVLSHLLSH